MLSKAKEAYRTEKAHQKNLLRRSWEGKEKKKRKQEELKRFFSSTRSMSFEKKEKSDVLF